MSNPAIFFDDWENKPLVIPVSNCANMQLNISTRNYNAFVIWGDNTSSSYNTSKNVDSIVNNISNDSKAYSPNFTGDIKVYLKGGLKDVYSYNFRIGVIGNDFHQQYNIQNLGLFLAQMPNLYSYRFDIYAYGVANRQPTIIGDFAQNPDSVERILIRSIDVKNRATALVLNFNNFKNTSKLKWFRKENGSGDAPMNALRFLGDIAKIPPLCTHFYIQEGDSILTATSAITYTSGRIWPSSFDTLSIPISLGDFLELDNIFIDLGNSITSAIGSKIINLGNGWITQKSAAQRSHLTGLGFTLSGFLDTSTGTASSTTKKFIGDIAQIPSDITFFKILQCANGSSITYTSGKVWASSFDTLQIPLSLSTSELDNLLIDMNNSITTKIGSGVISLGGFRSIASDSAVASLQSKVFNVNVNRGYQIVNLPFQNNFTDSGEMGMTFVAGGTSNLPTFELSGRKPGEYCAVFNGSQSIKTTTNLPVNSDKVTIAFWMKTNSTSVTTLIDSSPNFDANNAFGIALNNPGQLNKIQAWNRDQNYNNVTNQTTINDGAWRHFVAVIDRAQNGVNEIKFYENGVLMPVTKQYSTDNVGNFVNNILFIGQKGTGVEKFSGSLTRLKIYNYPLAPSEVSNLYNSEL